jgi:hypothetical protein
VEELMKAVRELRSQVSGSEPATQPRAAEPRPRPAAQPPVQPPPKPVPPARVDPSPAQEPPKPSPSISRRQDILDDPKLNSILASLPGATIIDIKEPRK